MTLLGSVSSKQVDDFAIALAREFAEQCPPEIGEKTARPNVPPKKLVQVLENLFKKAHGYRSQHKLGMYKKARLGNSFRWELTALGYDKDFAEDLTQRLVVYIARKA